MEAINKHRIRDIHKTNAWNPPKFKVLGIVRKRGEQVEKADVLSVDQRLFYPVASLFLEWTLKEGLYASSG